MQTIKSFVFTKKGFFFSLFLILLGVGFLAGINTFFHFTNTMEFCTSCHSMQVNLREYKETIHYKNPAGVRAVCSDCHVPKAFFPKVYAKIMAYKDVLHEILGTIDTQEKYEKHRWEMANEVWEKMKATDSRECRSCHDFATMDLEEQGRNAKKRHARAPLEGKTCIDCHKGIAHEEPEDPADAE